METDELVRKVAVPKRSGIMFHKDMLDDYAFIQREGKYQLICAHNVSEKNVINRPGGLKFYIITLKAWTPDKIDLLKEIFKDGPEVPIEAMDEVFLTFPMWTDVHTKIALPLKGEKLDVMIGHRKLKDGTRSPLLRAESLRIQDYVEIVEGSWRDALGYSSQEKADIVREALSESSALEHQ